MLKIGLSHKKLFEISESSRKKYFSYEKHHRDLTPPPPKPQQKLLSICENLENLCEKYEDFVESTRIKQSLTPICKHSDQFKPKPDPQIDFIINELNNRIKMHSKGDQIFLSSNRLKFEGESEEKRGPGSYKVKLLKKAEVHGFSKLPRLNSPISHNMNLVKNIQAMKTAKHSIIKKNRESVMNFEASREIFEKKKKYRKNLQINAKMLKKNLDLIAKNEKIEKIELKMKMFEWRMKKDELRKVKKLLVAAMFYIGISTCLVLKMKNKRKLRARWEVSLKKFVVILKIFAKFMKILKNVRKRIVEKRIKSFGPALSHFLLMEKSKKKSIVKDLILKYYSQPIFIVLMLKFRLNIVKLQKNIRSFIKVQQQRKKSLKTIWNLELPQIVTNSSKESKIIIPSEICKSFIEKHIKKSIKTYNNELAEFKSSYSKLRVNESRYFEDLKPPIFKLYSAKEEFRHVISSGLKFKVKLENIHRRRKFNIGK